MTFQQLLEQIKTEARIKGDSAFDDTVVGLINEVTKEAALSERPFELKQEIKILLSTTQRLIDLPFDFFVHHEILFHDSDTTKTYQLQDEDDAAQPAPRGMFGHPKTFEVLTSNQLFIKPFEQIVSGDSIFLVYYKKPLEIANSLASLTQINPIPRLEPFIIRACIRRIRMFHSDDPNMVQALSGDIASAGKIFAKDEPEKINESKRA